MAIDDNPLATVWLEDIEEQEEGLIDAWRYVHNYLTRVQSQEAPADLTEAMTEINNHLAEAVRKLGEIKPRFPYEPSPH